MAKRGSKASSSIKKSGSERLTGKKAPSSSICIRDYAIEGLEYLEPVTFYDNICLMIAATMVVVVLLVQLRCLRPDAPSAKMDQLPSYKFYKKRILTNDPGQCTAFILACSVGEALLLLPDDPTELEQFLIANLDCYQGNERFIEKCSIDNLSQFIYGHTSRIIGIMSSCCSANISVFGLANDCTSWTVSDVLSRIPFADVSKVPAEEVIKFIRKECLQNGTDGPVSPIIFQEIPFTGGDSVSGGCALEKSIFGDEFMPSRVAFTTGSPILNTNVVINLTDDQLKQGLTAIEFRKLQSAKSLGRNDLIKKYVDIATAKLNPKADA